jgi:outer membrane protein OmpA-like peptidoglycan-associated protein
MLLDGCYGYRPPYNEFERYNYKIAPTAAGATVGGIAGAIGGTAGTAVVGTALAGAAVGGAAGLAVGVYRESKRAILLGLNKHDIVYIQYGDTHTLIVPTDRYYLFNSNVLNDLCYPGLTYIIRLLQLYPKCTVHVAAFTDNIGSSRHKKMLTQARAEAMVTYLWANGIPAEKLNAQGYGDKHDVAPNSIIHGSAHNRRLEIQWFCAEPAKDRAAFIKNYVK